MRFTKKRHNQIQIEIYAKMECFSRFQRFGWTDFI